MLCGELRGSRPSVTVAGRRGASRDPEAACGGTRGYEAKLLAALNSGSARNAVVYDTHNAHDNVRLAVRHHEHSAHAPMTVGRIVAGTSVTLAFMKPTRALYEVLYSPLYTRIKPYHTDEAKDAKDNLLHHVQHLVPAMNVLRWQRLGQ